MIQQIREVTGSLLHNPYQYSGQVIAKLSVNIATMIWSFVVLIKPNALRNWPGSFTVFDIVHENIVAGVLLVLSILAILRLLKHSVPMRLGACVYGLFLLLWLYTWITLLLAIESNITVLRPGQLAGVTVIMFLAFFAFVSNPKKTDNGPAAA